MIIRLYTIFDSKTEAYLRPFYGMTNGEAERTFSDTVNDPGSMFNKHPSDFTLFEIGSYDDSNGLVEAIPPHSLGNALNFKHEDPS